MIFRRFYQVIIFHPSLIKFFLQHWQGGWERDESVSAAAARETLEEAGVRGVLEVAPLLFSAYIICECQTL